MARPEASQPSLFSHSEPVTLMDDASGRIVYHPACVESETAQTWFEALRDQVHWASARRMMYEREVDVPRLMARFRVDDPALPAPLVPALAIARRVAGCEFNTIGLNYYRDGNDSVAPHNDKLHELIKGEPIALLSLGATRRMTIRSKTLPRRVFDLDLAAGSLLLMTYTVQLHYDHGIPKSKTPVGPRISLAFRVRPVR
ncbi:MAG TPA: alpha-ketoglutarate-dependent dioxygenase AlkB [Rudaea sp.]